MSATETERCVPGPRFGVTDGCGHPWERHTPGGMCIGEHDGDECHCVLFPPEAERIRRFDAEFVPGCDTEGL